MTNIPIIRPTLPDFDNIEPEFRKIWESGMVTSATCVKSLEGAAAAFAGVKDAVAFSSCTSALVLSLKALGLSGEVILPSFTFAASAHAVVWAGLTPVFCDCMPETFNIAPDSLRRSITERTSAIMPVYCFGLPPDFDSIHDLAREHSLRVVADAAQGWGATYRGRPAGSLAKVECFSMSPTKVVTAIEGGLALTDDGDLAQKLRRLRDYGKAPDGEDMQWVGMSARMSELHAAVGLATLADTSQLVRRRRGIIEQYRAALGGLRGISFQHLPAGLESSGNYMVILVDPSESRLDRDALHNALRDRGVQTKRYFYPPVHAMTAYQGVGRAGDELAQTERIAARALALPLYSHMGSEDFAAVVRSLEELLG